MDFNPHHPRGWRLPTQEFLGYKSQISIHTTLAGGDAEKQQFYKKIKISIHTTLAGGDALQTSKLPTIAISIHTTLAGGDSLATL